MVKSRNPSRWSLLLIDAVGIGLLLASAAAVVWLTLFRFEARATESGRRQEALRAARWDLSTLEQAKARQSGLVLKRRQNLAARGHLPASAPVEGYAQALADWASRRELISLGQTPLPPRPYTGLTEHLMAYNVSGPLPSIARFLRDVEQSDYWADVSHLALESTLEGGKPGQVVAYLTFSLFSAGDDGAKASLGGGT